MINELKNKKNLQAFLEALSQESILFAEQQLSEAPPEDKEEDDEEDPIFGGADDEEEEDGEKPDPDMDMGIDSEPKDEPLEKPQPESKPEEPREAIRPVPLTLELGKVSSEGLLASMNMLRAGRSFKEPDIASQLRKYFEEHLDDKERLYFATILSGLLEVVAGSAAEDATSPDDENLDIDSTEPETEHRGEPKQQNVTPPAKTGDLEDTSPPMIRVGGSRNEAKVREYREKIKKILLS